MIRAFEYGTRVATAVKRKDGSVLEVYPSKKTFESLDAWKDSFEGKTFREEDPAEIAAKKQSRAKAKEEDILTRYTSIPKASDTPMQKVVRQLYGQLGLKDSLRQKTTKTNLIYHDILKLDPGIEVYNEVKGTIEPVYFNRLSGRVIFNTRDATHLPIQDYIFFRKISLSLFKVAPQFEELTPGKPVVLYVPNSFSGRKDVENLRAAGFSVIYANPNAGWPSLGWFKTGNEYTKNAKVLLDYPGVVGILKPEEEYISSQNRNPYFKFFDKQNVSPHTKKWSLDEWITSFRHQESSLEPAAH